MSHKPLIALTSSYRGDNTIALRHTYFGAVYDAGGIPVALERTEDPARIARYVADFDGFLFTGGVDVDPACYGEPITGEGVEIDAARDRFELLLCEAVLRSGKPVLGICRGIQLLNVARGGTLYQHIEGHRQSPVPAVERPQHVTVTPDTRLHALVGTGDIMVNSFHHQAIKDIAPALRVTAVADDGTVEAMEDPAHPFFLGVQWHPEYYHALCRTSKVIFDAFVEAASVARPQTARVK